MRECKHPCCNETCRKKKPKKIRKPIKPVSRKREKLNREYSKERKGFLNEGDLCEARLEGCTGLATELHHPAGRTGKKLLEVKKCKKVCRNCHHQIENAPNMAKQLGLSESRLALKQQ